MMIFEKTLANRQSYKPLLLLADEDDAILNSYIEQGDLYEVRMNEDIVGVALFIPIDEQTIELKNIALRPTYRGQGIAKEMIRQSELTFKAQGYTRMIIGTANSSINNIALYQKLGFRMYDIQRDFFNAYKKVIVEQGIQAVDLWMFEKLLK
ncbi:MAG: GNAT family N-acetyltransferase [Caryophanon sp.]|nr:GNAT family N-acetyltransferase [Caryophanon sp.]